MSYLAYAANRVSRRVPRNSNMAGRGYIPAPYKGLNTRDSLTEIKPGYALLLRNLFPTGQSVELRQGTTRYTDNVLDAAGSSVQSLLATGHEGAGSVRLFALNTAGVLGEITGGMYSGVPLHTFTANARLDHADMNGWTILCNGVDLPAAVQADGTFDATTEFWHGPDLDTTKLHGVTAHKNRLMFLEKDTANLWYGQLQSVRGVLTRFPLSGVSRGSGNAIALASMTVDGGEGTDDRLFIFMASGDVLVYTGRDIASADTWHLSGVYNIPRLVGDSPIANMQGDLLALTEGGIVSMSSLQRTGREGALGAALTTNVYNLLDDVADAFGHLPGWDVLVHKNMLIVNVPTQDGLQLVMNTVTGAWCTFNGMDARCWLEHEGELYFGATDGHVYHALDEDANYTDKANVGTGEFLTWLVQFAYSNFRSTKDKHFKLARLLVEATGSIQYGVGTLLDYDTVHPVPEYGNSISNTQGDWDTSDWDIAEWGSDFARQRLWKSVNQGFGTAVSLYAGGATKGAAVKVHAGECTYEIQQGVLNQ